MINGEDPTIRRRQDREVMNERDQQAWQLQRAGWSVRSIGRHLGMAASSVQRCLQRAQKREQLAAAMATGSPGEVIAALDDGLSADDMQTLEDIERLNKLERWRLQHVPGPFGDIERARVRAEREAWWARECADRREWQRSHPGEDYYAQDRFKVSDGTHWTAGVDTAMADDSGVDNDGDW